MERIKSGWDVVMVFSLLALILVMVVVNTITRPITKNTEMPARFYSIQWLSSQTDFSKVRIDAFALASITTPKNGEVIEVIAYLRKAPVDKIFGLPFAANFFEARSQDARETARFIQKGYKDHSILVALKKSLPQPTDIDQYSTKGIWHNAPGERPYFEVTDIQKYKS